MLSILVFVLEFCLLYKMLSEHPPPLFVGANPSPTRGAASQSLPLSFNTIVHRLLPPHSARRHQQHTVAPTKHPEQDPLLVEKSNHGNFLKHCSITNTVRLKKVYILGFWGSRTRLNFSNRVLYSERL